MRADDQLGGVAELLQRWKGDEEALHALVPLVYKELRRLPHSYLAAARLRLHRQMRRREP